MSPLGYLNRLLSGYVRKREHIFDGPFGSYSSTCRRCGCDRGNGVSCSSDDTTPPAAVRSVREI